MLFSKKYETTKPFIPFSSREYETRISKLTSREYELFKKLLFGSELIEKKEKNIKILYKKLDVSSQIELMAKYGKNYYHEMEGNFNSKEIEI